jgi:hypothetical protein
MPKTFITERDVDDLCSRGISQIELNDNVVMTDAAVERAMKRGIKLSRVENSAPKASFSPSVNLLAAYPRSGGGDAETKSQIKAAVLARLDGSVDDALLDAIITKVLAGMV